MNQDLIAYYNARAQEYEKVYLNPAEQGDLQASNRIFQRLFAQKTVLEIACGTGYWTGRIAEAATSILATDINESVVDIARHKVSGENIRFAVADMYTFVPEQPFQALFGGFIWSHILLQDLDPLLDKLRSFLYSGASFAFIDSNPVAGTKHALDQIAKIDEHGNTFQLRQLENGSSHLVLKNFPDTDFLHQKFSRIATDIEVTHLHYYWIVSGVII